MEEARQSDDLTVYNFWATWCAPCIAEMPIIAEFTLNYDHQLIFVNVDRQNLWESRVPQMLKKLNLQEEVYLLDKPKLNNWYQMIDENWGAGLPVTLFVGQGQNVLFQGPLEEKDLKEITGKFNKDY
jgi:thiol-disulfide isomerase/thioredoxin